MSAEMPGPVPVEARLAGAELTLPQNDMALKLYARYLRRESRRNRGSERKFTEANQVALGEFLPKIFEHQLNNVGSFAGPEGGRLLYSKININQLAGELTGNPVTTSGENKKVRRIFIYHTFLQTDKDGNVFGLAEKANDYALRYLPKAVSAATGKKPSGEDAEAYNEDTEIYIVGAMTGPLGEVPQDFPEKVREQGFAAFAPINAAFIESTLPPSDSADRANTEIRLDGNSLGSSIAVATRDKLESDGIINVTVLADAPAGFGEEHSGRSRKNRIRLGFGKDVATQFARFFARKNPVLSVAMHEGKFAARLNEILLDKDPSLAEGQDEQAALKKKVIAETKAQLYKGTPMREIKGRTVVRRGLYDPLLHEEDFVDSAENEADIYSIDMTHAFPTLGPLQLTRWGRAAGMIHKTLHPDPVAI